MANRYMGVGNASLIIIKLQINNNKMSSHTSETGIIPKHTKKTLILPDVCIYVHCRTYYLSMTFKLSRFPMTNKWIKSLRHIYIMEYCATIIKDNICNWRDPEDIMLQNKPEENRGWSLSSMNKCFSMIHRQHRIIATPWHFIVKPRLPSTKQ